jgi:hypothetical protein
MVPRPILLVGLLIAFSVGCAPTWRQTRATPARPPDPDRWARTACLHGEYPSELDSRAYAMARQRDLTAERQGLANPSATARLIDGRSTFAVRCAKWREPASAITLVSTDRSGQ